MQVEIEVGIKDNEEPDAGDEEAPHDAEAVHQEGNIQARRGDPGDDQGERLVPGRAPLAVEADQRPQAHGRGGHRIPGRRPAEAVREIGNRDRDQEREKNNNAD